MSVNPDSSFLTKLHNKVTYKLNAAVDDPDAAKFAEDRKANEEQQKQQALAAKEAPGPASPQDQSTDTPPSTSSRIGTKIWNGFTKGITMLWYPIACVVLAMFVANDMIVYAAPVRVIFFVFTFLVCYYFSYMFGALAFGYIIKKVYQWHNDNNVEDNSKDIMPTIFAMLPTTTNEPTTLLSSIAFAPFWYPQSEQKANALPDITNQYWNQLQESFPGLDELKTLPIFTTGLQKARSTLDHLHDPPKKAAENVPLSEHKPALQNTNRKE